MRRDVKGIFWLFPSLHEWEREKANRTMKIVKCNKFLFFPSYTIHTLAFYDKEWLKIKGKDVKCFLNGNSFERKRKGKWNEMGFLISLHFHQGWIKKMLKGEWEKKDRKMIMTEKVFYTVNFFLKFFYHHENIDFYSQQFASLKFYLN